MLKNSVRLSIGCSKLFTNSIKSTNTHHSSIRNFNITSSVHIEKIGKQLIEKDDDQVIVLNLPYEKDYLLPKHLIKNGVKNLVLCVNNQSQSPESALTKNEYENVHVLKKVDFLKLKLSERLEDMDRTIYDTILEYFKPQKWTDKPTGKLFMIVSNKDNHILRSLTSQAYSFYGLFSKGRIELYVLVSEHEYKRFTSKSYSRIFSFNFYNFAFDVELLDKFACSDLKITGKKKIAFSRGSCYFIKLTPRAALSDHSPEFLSLFIQFLSKTNVSKKSLVIAFFESWSPGIGLKLIDLGYSVFTTFDDLELEDLLRIFTCLLNDDEDSLREILTQHSEHVH